MKSLIIKLYLYQPLAMQIKLFFIWSFFVIVLLALAVHCIE